MGRSKISRSLLLKVSLKSLHLFVFYHLISHFTLIFMRSDHNISLHGTSIVLFLDLIASVSDCFHGYRGDETEIKGPSFVEFIGDKM